MKTYAVKLAHSEFKLLRLSETAAPNVAMEDPEAAVRWLRPQLAASLRYNSDVENFMVLHLNTRQRPIGWEVISNGGLNTILVHAREVFRAAIILNAAAIILAHNHPSGDPTPSDADIRVTRNLVQAGKTIGIDVLDHLILGCEPRPSVPRRGEGGGVTAKDFISLRACGYIV